MAKAIKSTDPRKAAIVARMKYKAACTKITNLVEVAPGEYQGDAMTTGHDQYGRRLYRRLGAVTITQAELSCPLADLRDAHNAAWDAQDAEGVR